MPPPAEEGAERAAARSLGTFPVSRWSAPGSPVCRGKAEDALSRQTGKRQREAGKKQSKSKTKATKEEEIPSLRHAVICTICANRDQRGGKN